MLKKTTLFLLFLVSYIPLFLILSIQNINDRIYSEQHEFIGINTFLLQNKLSIFFLIFSVIVLLFYFLFSGVNNKYNFQNPVKILKVENTGVEYLSYLATYIIPYIGLKFDTWNNITATGILFLIIGFIYTKTNLLYANPTLALFGYYIFKVKLENEEERVVISKGKIKKDKFYAFKELSDDIYYIKISK